ncbi:SPOR domain-containing protein [Aquimarina sp. MMG016]|uniref:SPOR domain-containing protein n=1 Tax=Aquimarina sp. MMG016 TaxID=2822690 RepID=UPI001B3A18DF|nr:SPOR domain-containing protein [Aquimarina sp. MMG016]MBQ4819156.1 SPOR domain-containing protein [Aquimarina sp. MMG016]
MKVIKDEDLLSLHYQIEKAEVQQQKLEELLRKKSKKLEKSNRSAKILGITSIGLLLFTVFLLMNSFLDDSLQGNDIAENVNITGFHEELDSLRMELTELEQNKADLEVIKDLYLYRNLINKDIVYSVQINSFRGSKGDKVSALSDKYINGRVYSDTSFFKLSLGVFETLPEAQEYRKTLMESGFSKNIFVISYKDGKRIKIENPN